MVSNRKLLFQVSIFGCHVSFRGCNIYIYIYKWKMLLTSHLSKKSRRKKPASVNSWHLGKSPRGCRDVWTKEEVGGLPRGWPCHSGCLNATWPRFRNVAIRAVGKKWRVTKMSPKCGVHKHLVAWENQQGLPGVVCWWFRVSPFFKGCSKWLWQTPKWFATFVKGTLR